MKQICSSCNKYFSDLLYDEAVKSKLIKGTLCDKCLEKRLISLRVEILNATEASKICAQYGEFPISFPKEEYDRLTEDNK